MLVNPGEVFRRRSSTCFSARVITRPSPILLNGARNPPGSILHQRRPSSSKASNTSKDEHRAIASTAKATAGQTKHAPSPNSSNVTRQRRRRGREAALKGETSNDFNLPSVPSTQGIRPLDIHCAKFFSEHRPISISHIIPPSITNKAFSDLFEPRQSRASHSRDQVVDTLSGMVDQLDLAASRFEKPKTPEDVVDLRMALSQATGSNALDAQDSRDPFATSHQQFSNPFLLDLNELSQSYKPFVPPPAPVPQSAKKSLRTTKASQKQDSPIEEIDTGRDTTQPSSSTSPKQRTYTSTVTVYETTHADGAKTFKTFATPIARATVPQSSQRSSRLRNTNPETIDLDPKDRSHLPSISTITDPDTQAMYEIDERGPFSPSFIPQLEEEPIRQSFLERLKERKSIQLRNAGGRTMHAISVKRQRKLKMKKHKYKKLMKRTRHLRRKLKQA